MCLSNNAKLTLYSTAAVLAVAAQVVPAHAANISEFASHIEQRLSVAIRDGDYLPPDATELTRAQAFFLRLATGATPAELAVEAGALKLNLESLGPLVLVSEADGARRGRGFFVFRRDARPDVLLVPHGFKDEMTRDIGLSLFKEGSFSGAAWNTVPRNYQRGSTWVDADMAHLHASWFTAFTVAVARAWPTGQTVQLHGFEQGKRKSEAGAAADVILSNGTQNPHPQLRQQARCLGSMRGYKVALYPDEIRELGGTTNAQVAALAGLGYPAFVHLETSKALRQTLRDDSATRSLLLRCLQP